MWNFITFFGSGSLSVSFSEKWGNTNESHERWITNFIPAGLRFGNGSLLRHKSFSTLNQGHSYLEGHPKWKETSKRCVIASFSGNKQHHLREDWRYLVNERFFLKFAIPNYQVTCCFSCTSCCFICSYLCLDSVASFSN